MNKKIDKISKVLSLVLAFVMVLGVAIPALATEGEEVKPTLKVEIEQTKEQVGTDKATLTLTQTKAEEEAFKDVSLAFETDNKDKQEKQVIELDEVKTSTNITQAKDQIQAVIKKAEGVNMVSVADDKYGAEENKLFTDENTLTSFISAIKAAYDYETKSAQEIDVMSQELTKAIETYLEAQDYGVSRFQGEMDIPGTSFINKGENEGVSIIEVSLPSLIEKEQTVTVTATIFMDEEDNIVEKDTITLPSNIQFAKGKLEAKLEEADKVEIVAVSEDGKDVIDTKNYTTAEENAKFVKAITDAKEVLAKEDASVNEVNKALENLDEAITEYIKASKKLGLAIELKNKDIIDGKATAKAVEDTNYYDVKGNLLFTVNEIKGEKAYVTYPDGRKVTVDVVGGKITLAVVAAPTEQVVNINVYTADMGVDKKVPVAGSKFEVYHAKRAEDNSLSLGKFYTDATTDDKGNIRLVLPLTEKEIIFTGEGDNAGYEFFQVPYLIKQVDGGSDEKVRPYEGLIMAEGYYDLDGFKGEAYSLTIGVKPGTEEINIEIKNKRDEAGRITGEDIYETSVELAKDMYPNGSKKVVIATANEEKLADALTAGSLANLYDAPILLVDGENISDSVRDYLKNPNNKVEEIVLIGGKNTINEDTEKLLNFWFPEAVERIQGSNRFQTAVEVAKIVQKESKVSNFIVANGEGNDKFVDALSATAVAGEYGYPVLVTSADELVTEAADFIKDSKAENVYVIGGKTSIKEDVVEDLAKVLDKEAKVERFAGKNRNETAIAVAKAFFPEAEHAVYVNGDQNQLVLVAGTYAAKQSSPVILVGFNDVPGPAKEYLPTSAIKDGTVIGSIESVSEEVRLELGKLVR